MLNLSVLVTCYNKEKYLDECIQSIDRQTKEPKEIVLVHDGCDEPMAHAKADTIILKTNGGVSKARDTAYKFSTGELILFVDADDVLDPDYLEKMVLVISKGADVAYPDIFLWQGKYSQLTVTPKKITPKFVEKFEKVVIPVTCLMNRKLYEKLGGFKEMPVLEDVDFWIRAICNGYTFRKAETLLWYRRYEGTRNSLDQVKRKQVMKEILSQFDVVGDKFVFKKGT